MDLIQTIQVITIQIEEAYAALESSKSDIVMKALCLGSKLNDAKGIVDHGEFQNYIADNFEFSYETARKYMLLAHNRAKITDLKNNHECFLSVREALRLISDDSPKSERFKFKGDVEIIPPAPVPAPTIPCPSRPGVPLSAMESASEDEGETTAPPSVMVQPNMPLTGSNDGEPRRAGTLPKVRETRETTRPVPPTPSESMCAVKDLEQLILSGQKFSTIYADPPWSYSNQATRAATDNHYLTMSVDDIAALPIGQLAADSAHLHLWTTNAFIFDCKRIMEAWGFEYKSMMIWAKPQMGIGNYWRVSHEILLLGVRGSAPFQAHDEMSWTVADRTQHSAKPETFREKIERVSRGPFLELFARRTAPGWVSWGNEIERDLFNAHMEAAI